jgi:hypothetical protein
VRNLVVDEPVAGDEAVAVFTRQGVCDKRSAGAFDDQAAGRDVPEADPGLDIGVKAAAGDISQGQCCR